MRSKGKGNQVMICRRVGMLAAVLVELVFCFTARASKIDTTDKHWTWMKGSDICDQPGFYGTQGITGITNTPGARHRSISWTDASGNLWLFGGRICDDPGDWGNINDLWRYDQASGSWTWIKGSQTVGQPGVYGVLGVADPVNSPGARHGAVSWTAPSGELWLFG